MVVEAAPVVPGDEDGRRFPIRAATDRVDDARHPCLTDADARRRMLADAVVRHDPRDRGQPPVSRRLEAMRDGRDVLQLPVAANGREPRERVPDPGGVGALVVALAEDLAVLAAVRLVALEDVVAPGDVVSLE